MKIWQLSYPHNLQHVTAPDLKRTDDKVKIKITKALLSESDVAVYSGAVKVPTPFIPGRFAIGQVTPGIIAVNVATFIGNKRKGILGGVFATIGLVTGPLIIITLIAAVLTTFAENEYVKHAFAGIRVCVCVLIFSAIARLWKKSVPDIPAFIICVILFGMSAFGEHIPVIGQYISPIWMVILAAIAGIVIQSVRASKKSNGGDGK